MYQCHERLCAAHVDEGRKYCGRKWNPLKYRRHQAILIGHLEERMWVSAMEKKGKTVSIYIPVVAWEAVFCIQAVTVNLWCFSLLSQAQILVHTTYS